MEPLGTRIRRQRRRLGLTLDELAGRTAISKPYLSLIETGRVLNPPSDEKLRKLEQSLGFNAGDLVSQAHIQRTPKDIRAVLGKLLSGRTEGKALKAELVASSSSPQTATLVPRASEGVDLDAAYLSGVLQQLVDGSAGNVEQVASNAVPVINKVSAGYPKDFTDMSYPKGVADEYVGCPDVQDKDAFAARVHGDSMTPKYRPDDIVIFSPALSPKNGDDCFVRFADGQTTFKRVFFEADGDGKAPSLRLQPRNEKYRARVVRPEEVTGMWKAVYKYQRVDEE